MSGKKKSKKKLKKEVSVLCKVIAELQNELENNEEINDRLHEIASAKEVYLLQFMSENSDVSTVEEVEHHFDIWMEINGYTLEDEDVEEQEEDEPQELWTMDEVLGELEPPEVN